MWEKLSSLKNQISEKYREGQILQQKNLDDKIRKNSNVTPIKPVLCCLNINGTERYKNNLLLVETNLKLGGVMFRNKNWRQIGQGVMIGHSNTQTEITTLYNIALIGSVFD